MLEKTFLAELNKKTFNTITSKLSPKKAANSDIEELFEFQKSIEEFSLDERHRESFGKEMIENSKTVILFYDKPNAGKLYKKIGFQDVGKWSIGTIR